MYRVNIKQLMLIFKCLKLFKNKMNTVSNFNTMSASTSNTQSTIEKNNIKCARCGYSTDRKGNLMNHLNKKQPCKAKFQDISVEDLIKQLDEKHTGKLETILCEFCHGQVTKANYSRHRNSCKEKPEETVKIDITTLKEQLTEEITKKVREELQHEIQVQLQNELSRMQNVHNSTSTSATSIREDVVEDNKRQQEQTKKKQNIPNSRRIASWNAHIGVEVGQAKCMCCQENLITQHKFNCGHVISEADGGTIEVSNLRPICYDCNNDMGSRNMREFAARVYNVTLA